ncbi:MAG: hypothetical protein R3Y22_01485 [Bacteroidales bacterium]
MEVGNSTATHITYPRNKELMRVYRDLELVESLGYGVPRIVDKYGKESFIFMHNFTRMVLPISTDYLNIAGKQVSDQVSDQVSMLIKVLDGEMDSIELQTLINVNHRTYFRNNYIKPAIIAGYVELTIPDKPTSRNQKYRLTKKGAELKGKLQL